MEHLYRYLLLPRHLVQQKCQNQKRLVSSAVYLDMNRGPCIVSEFGVEVLRYREMLRYFRSKTEQMKDSREEIGRSVLGGGVYVVLHDFLKEKGKKPTQFSNRYKKKERCVRRTSEWDLLFFLFQLNLIQIFLSIPLQILHKTPTLPTFRTPFLYLMPFLRSAHEFFRERNRL